VHAHVHNEGSEGVVRSGCTAAFPEERLPNLRYWQRGRGWLCLKCCISLWAARGEEGRRQRERSIAHGDNLCTRQKAIFGFAFARCLHSWTPRSHVDNKRAPASRSVPLDRPANAVSNDIAHYIGAMCALHAYRERKVHKKGCYGNARFTGTIKKDAGNMAAV
jgi:hypothetical protein